MIVVTAAAGQTGTSVVRAQQPCAYADSLDRQFAAAAAPAGARSPSTSPTGQAGRLPQ